MKAYIDAPLLAILKDKFPSAEYDSEATQPAVYVPAADIVAVLSFLRDDERFAFARLENLTSVDYKTYFEMVYHLFNWNTGAWITVKVKLEHERPTVSFITEQLHKAIERENTDACLAERKALLERKMGELERQRGFGCLMGRAAADWQIRRLQGRNPGSSWCFARPGYSAHCEWFNRYVHPTLFLPLKHMNKCKATKRKEK